MLQEEFKDRLKKAIEIRNIKQIELSEKTNISRSTISQYMSGYAKPKSKKLYLIAQALDVNEAWLMGYDVPMERNIQKETKSSSDTNPINEHEEEKDIEKIIDELMEQQGLMLCGKPMSKNSLMLLRNSIRSTLELAKSMNEEKEKNNK